ncbi:MAG TPA: hypothetical protein VK427_03635 [Kofleriaceae bacterium]|nr:hypothetical protein [Kofleriaceae bacterium]
MRERTSNELVYDVRAAPRTLRDGSCVRIAVLAFAAASMCPASAWAQHAASDVEDDEPNSESSWEALADGPSGASPNASRALAAPPVADVLEAAYAAAGLDRDPARSWSRRARVAGLIPSIAVRTGWDQRWREDEPDVGRNRTFEVRATWRLDRLLFDGRELQASSIDAARRRERRRLANRVIKAYFTWRKLAALAHENARYALSVEAATAELDALTDGWFSEQRNSAR